MIALTVEQAAARACVTVATIEEWITGRLLVAVRSDIDGHRYVDVDRLLDVERDMRRTGASQLAAPEPLPLPMLAHWLWNRGYPVTERALRDWVERRWLVAVVQGGGRGRHALYDPVVALQLAIRMKETA